MIVVFDSKIKTIEIYPPGYFFDMDAIGGDSFMKFGDSDEIIKVPSSLKSNRNFAVTSYKDGIITIDHKDSSDNPPLHYYEMGKKD